MTVKTTSKAAWLSVLDRLSEPSSYAGIAAILGVAGVTVPMPVLHDVMLAGSVIAGLAAIVIKEGWKAALDDALPIVESTAAAVSQSPPDSNTTESKPQ
ncbi:hypothetical protein [Acidiphilium sp.]|uniref:hypothetical protein n=1 Tax=Acidiphilium sp. TaxID=527 RepID=UPI003D05FFFB